MAKSGVKSNAALVRQLVLVLLLVVAGGAAIYDFRVARPAAQDAYNVIEKMTSAGDDESVTNLDIQKVLNKKPSVTLSGNNTHLEKYSWMSGLLFKSYYVWVVYTPSEPHIFQAHFLNTAVDEMFKHDYKIPGNPSPPPGAPSAAGGRGAASDSAPPSGGPPGGPPPTTFPPGAPGPK